ncbi:MAG: 50S ribosome-binding GTPase [Acidobacteria bacterium]|nr:50S ribosome-binding GTPase [Acidobacteriota bacterium]
MIPFFRGKRKKRLRMVVGLNQVDKMCPGGWDERLNAPTKAAEKEIRRRTQDIVHKLSDFADISPEHIEYYSALRRYRLLPLLSKVIGHAHAGFKLDQVQPADPFGLAHAEVQEFVREERVRRGEGNGRGNGQQMREKLFEEIKKILSPEEMDDLTSEWKREMRQPPKVAILGKAGVGKTTTINNLFNAQWRTSHTLVGTTQAQAKEFELESGGTLTVVDLPGYGRTLREDEEYEKIYRDLIPSCDLVLLVVQADSRDFADDQEIILKLRDWLEDAPVPQR